MQQWEKKQKPFICIKRTQFLCSPLCFLVYFLSIFALFACFLVYFGLHLHYCYLLLLSCSWSPLLSHHCFSCLWSPFTPFNPLLFIIAIVTCLCPTFHHHPYCSLLLHIIILLLIVTFVPCHDLCCYLWWWYSPFVVLVFFFLSPPPPPPPFNVQVAYS